MNILVVEDDLNLSNALVEILNEESHIVDAVYDGVDAVYYAANNSYDAIVLDIMMPKINGYEAIKLIREQGIATPTIMLTAKSEIADRVKGLDLGADDYLTKPFAPEELLARIRAISRRLGEVVLDEVKYSDISLNLSTHALSGNEKSITLNNKEYKMMEIFIKSPGTIITKDNFINKVWGIDSDIVDNNIEAYISFLRKKMKFVGTTTAIYTIRKTGYILKDKMDD